MAAAHLTRSLPKGANGGARRAGGRKGGGVAGGGKGGVETAQVAAAGTNVAPA